MQKVNNTRISITSIPTSLSSPYQHPIPHPALLKADTGASATSVKLEHAKYLSNLNKTNQGPRVHLPNNTILRPSHTGTLSLNDSPKIHTYVLPEMKNESLLSVGQLCDQGCKAIFTKNDICYTEQ